jgi:hypothetical protein
MHSYRAGYAQIVVVVDRNLAAERLYMPQVGGAASAMCQSLVWKDFVEHGFQPVPSGAAELRMAPIKTPL